MSFEEENKNKRKFESEEDEENEYNQKENELESSKLKKSRKEMVDQEGNVIEEEDVVDETNKSEKEEGEDEENEKNNLDESFDISSSEEEEDEEEANEKVQNDVRQSVDLLDSDLVSKKFGIQSREDLELLSRSSRAAKLYQANEAELQRLRSAQEHDESMEFEMSTSQANAGDQSMSKSSKQLNETSNKEMTRKKRIEQLEEENKKMQFVFCLFKFSFFFQIKRT
jgi:hypothetical protein